ncbi:hypothetical protein K0I73_01215 [Shewanella mesophila]|uniref:hypothetical protein n=1 Tax=Shewanella mesophila TaxID=2864208 RepID=UPI001C65CC8F|nr:hypothetical protein [Shewanella mesophila]QYJ86414.1 hypothetical protein K0I73_01215 [Shewanella mesophila]
MKNRLLFALLATFGFSGAALSDSNNQRSIEEIRSVVEVFRVSIIQKDKERFKSLFYSDNIPFIAVFSDEMLDLKRKENPNYPRSVDFGKFGSPIERMISDEEEQEEKIWNVQIETDGYLGSVHFNYSDHVDGYKRAWGTEAWDLVKEDTGWKIVSVTFTVTENTEPNENKS